MTDPFINKNYSEVQNSQGAKLALRREKLGLTQETFAQEMKKYGSLGGDDATKFERDGGRFIHAVEAYTTELPTVSKAALEAAGAVLTALENKKGEVTIVARPKPLAADRAAE